MSTTSIKIVHMKNVLFKYIPRTEHGKFPSVNTIIATFEPAIRKAIFTKQKEISTDGWGTEEQECLENSYLDILYQVRDNLSPEDYQTLARKGIKNIDEILDNLSKWLNSPQREAVKKQNEGEFAGERWQNLDRHIMLFKKYGDPLGDEENGRKHLELLHEMREDAFKRHQQYLAAKQAINDEDISQD